jgi:hypothetical protein
VNDALLVCMLERARDLFSDTERVVQRKRSLLDALGKRRAFDLFHNETSYPSRAFESINVCDVGVIERSQDLRFALKARHALGIAGKFRRESFQSDCAVQLGVTGPVDFAPAAGSER